MRWQHRLPLCRLIWRWHTTRRDNAVWISTHLLHMRRRYWRGSMYKSSCILTGRRLCRWRWSNVVFDICRYSLKSAVWQRSQRIVTITAISDWESWCLVDRVISRCSVCRLFMAICSHIRCISGSVQITSITLTSWCRHSQVYGAVWFGRTVAVLNIPWIWSRVVRIIQNVNVAVLKDTSSTCHQVDWLHFRKAVTILTRNNLTTWNVWHFCWSQCRASTLHLRLLIQCTFICQNAVMTSVRTKLEVHNCFFSVSDENCLPRETRWLDTK